jgi:hypothetical protein
VLSSGQLDLLVDGSNFKQVFHKGYLAFSFDGCLVELSDEATQRVDQLRRTSFQ